MSLNRESSRMSMGREGRLKVWFAHPDLGIGGAEMLVVNAATSLLALGHDVQIFTSYHDPGRCFNETKPEGPLGDRIHVHGNYFPRSFLGKFIALSAVVRMLWVSLVIVIYSLVGIGPDILVCDQVSHIVPFLRWGTGKRVVFYCHFPDKLLCVERTSVWKKVYRWSIDWWEEASVGTSDAILVNSEFTKRVFRESFKVLAYVPLYVLYPPIDLNQFERSLSQEAREKAYQTLPDGFLAHKKSFGDESVLLISINRFERKKNLNLAIETLHKLQKLCTKEEFASVHLVLAGGYDSRLEENVSYFLELDDYVKKNGLEKKVSFLRSFSDDQRLLLLESATCVLYTPENEHFGIVPLEAMYMRCPVVAVASGGPLETVSQGKSGFLVEDGANGFAESVLCLMKDRVLAKEMGLNGRADVINRFSKSEFGKVLEKSIRDCCEQGPAESFLARITRVFCFLFVFVCLVDASYRMTNKLMLAWLWLCIPAEWFRKFADMMT